MKRGDIVKFKLSKYNEEWIGKIIAFEMGHIRILNMSDVVETITHPYFKAEILYKITEFSYIEVVES